eukprot:CAMPEP_0206434568 /NCGR_PEP_ID=MMETSP0324_2-20121206/9250_1 /ASSEMBLY_ACC=CAM_ASM_000836 /TAXON_ID=2866 /ORGANISM="Crypthecodinium cohnii, Strain Seligo" /LENGTH=134 /DNA_ID=CAMNT_0053901137 /DNA_START=321 /DNA_END=721 /DNA_ORIENTATION=+
MSPTYGQTQRTCSYRALASKVRAEQLRHRQPAAQRLLDALMGGDTTAERTGGEDIVPSLWQDKSGKTDDSLAAMTFDSPGWPERGEHRLSSSCAAALWVASSGSPKRSSSGLLGLDLQDLGSLFSSGAEVENSR